MGHRTREEPPDDEDDLLGDDLDADPADVADEALPAGLLDDEMLGELEELDALGDPALDRTLDEFVLDPALLRDDDGTDLDEEAWPDEAHPSELPTLPWSTRAALPELGLDLAAILDPTRDVSEWVHPRPERARLRAVVLVGGLRGEIELTVREGPEEQLRIGRDWLSGRALVDSGRRS